MLVLHIVNAGYLCEDKVSIACGGIYKTTTDGMVLHNIGERNSFCG